MSSWLSPAPVPSVELSAGLTGIDIVALVAVAGATMGSWFLLKMFLMVAEFAAGAGGEEESGINLPEALPKGPGDISKLKTMDVSPSAAQRS